MLTEDVFICVLREWYIDVSTIGPLVNAVFDLATRLVLHTNIMNRRKLTAARIRANATFGNGL